MGSGRRERALQHAHCGSPGSDALGRTAAFTDNPDCVSAHPVRCVCSIEASRCVIVAMRDRSWCSVPTLVLSRAGTSGGLVLRAQGTAVADHTVRAREI